jgi:hypothetical protein
MIRTGVRRWVVVVAAAAAIGGCSSSSTSTVAGQTPVTCSFAMMREYAVGGAGSPTEEADKHQTLTACKSRAEWLAAAKSEIAQDAAPNRSGITLVGGVTVPRRGATLHNTAPEKLLAQFCRGNESLSACKR